MYDDLKGKYALITGSGKRSGIGYAITRVLAENGVNVFIADLGKIGKGTGDVKTATENEMNEIAGELESSFKVKAIPINLDVTDPESVNAMVDKIKETTEYIDILCNNAGASFGVPGALHSYDNEAWMKTIDVNLHGVFHVSRAVVPLMQGRAGSIINTSSRASKVPPILNGAYAVAKAGVNMFTKVMARELAGAGIRVNAICPGQIQTDLEKWRFGLEAKFYQCTVEEREAEMCKTIPLGRIGDPGEVGELVAFLASSSSSYITGQAINITGGQLLEY
ncbi:SDR family NAD(P)-dependent oxidoreductase [Spirochaetota bacterium]